MTKFKIFQKTPTEQEIKIYTLLDTDQSFVPTSHEFENKEDAINWIKEYSSYYVIKEE